MLASSLSLSWRVVGVFLVLWLLLSVSVSKPKVEGEGDPRFQTDCPSDSHHVPFDVHSVPCSAICFQAKQRGEGGIPDSKQAVCLIHNKRTSACLHKQGLDKNRGYYSTNRGLTNKRCQKPPAICTCFSAALPAMSSYTWQPVGAPAVTQGGSRSKKLEEEMGGRKEGVSSKHPLRRKDWRHHAAAPAAC